MKNPRRFRRESRFSASRGLRVAIVDLRRPVRLRDRDIDVTLPISPTVCLLAHLMNGLAVREFGGAEAARVSGNRGRYAYEQVLGSSEVVAPAARTVFTKLRD